MDIDGSLYWVVFIGVCFGVGGGVVDDVNSVFGDEVGEGVEL